MADLEHVLVLGAALFCIGMYGALAKRNTIAVLMSIELMLNGLNLTLVGFNRYIQPPAGAAGSLFAGQVFALFIIAVAAAEAALGLAIVIAIYRLRHTVQVDEFDMLRG